MRIYGVLVSALVWGIGMQAQVPEASNPLLMAARQGNISEIKSLLAAGADINAQGDDGWSPLMVAARYNRIGVVKVLLAAGADVNKISKGGVNAVYAASLSGSVAAISMLARAGASLNRVKEGAPTPLAVAAKEGREWVVRILLRHGADPMHYDYGTSPLGHAIVGCHLGTTRALLSMGADINQLLAREDDSNQQGTAMLREIMRDVYEGERAVKVARLLLEFGAQFGDWAQGVSNSKMPSLLDSVPTIRERATLIREWLDKEAAKTQGYAGQFTHDLLPLLEECTGSPITESAVARNEGYFSELMR